ncbi:hypothetical protein RRG08_061307 [Elysia crispata]|uniref:Uncharacterized protein n=1 Tax=Elysia crispata TaxID=231223 RepID=A0AAE0YFF4_9GAST|nr:hypothetical protein RRG08_061307 [Elysia crispata]
MIRPRCCCSRREASFYDVACRPALELNAQNQEKMGVGLKKSRSRLGLALLPSVAVCPCPHTVISCWFLQSAGGSSARFHKHAVTPHMIEFGPQYWPFEQRAHGPVRGYLALPQVCGVGNYWFYQFREEMSAITGYI